MGALGARWRGMVGMARDWLRRVASEGRMQERTFGKKAATSVARLALQISLEDHFLLWTSLTNDNSFVYLLLSLLSRGFIMDSRCAGRTKLRNVACKSTICWSNIYLPHLLVVWEEKTPDTRPGSTTPCSQKFENGIRYGRILEHHPKLRAIALGNPFRKANN